MEAREGEERVELFYRSLRELDVIYSKAIYDLNLMEKLEVDLESLKYTPRFLEKFGVKVEDVEMIWAWSPTSFALSIFNNPGECPYIKVRTSSETIKILCCSDNGRKYFITERRKRRKKLVKREKLES